jgi:hypothetical protein
VPDVSETKLHATVILTPAISTTTDHLETWQISKITREDLPTVICEIMDAAYLSGMLETGGAVVFQIVKDNTPQKDH